MKTKHVYPYKVYNKNYHNRRYYRNLINHPPFLRIQDEFAAFCYGINSVTNYDDVEKLMGLPKYGSYCFANPPRSLHRERAKIFKSKYNTLPPNFCDGGDTVLRKDWTILNQIEVANQISKNKPQKVLDMGGGIGLLGSAFSHIGIETIVVDPFDLKKENILDQSNVTKVDFVEQIEKDLHTFDLLIFCSSIEHIPKDHVLEIMKEFKNGTIVITNTLCNHPIDIGQEASKLEHCALINDEYYDEICNMFPIVSYREESHLVCRSS